MRSGGTAPEAICSIKTRAGIGDGHVASEAKNGETVAHVDLYPGILRLAHCGNGVGLLVDFAAAMSDSAFFRYIV